MEKVEMEARIGALTVALGVVIAILHHGESARVLEAVSGIAAHTELLNAIRDEAGISAADARGWRDTFDALGRLGAAQADLDS